MRALLILCIFVVACQPEVAPQQPTVVPFPTVTAGRTLYGVLQPVTAQPDNGGVIANPATVAALANQPTATPNMAACPPEREATLADDIPGDVAAEIVRFLSAGGSLDALEDGLRDDWALLDEDGVIRVDTDFTGEGEAEVIISYVAPDDGGVFLVLGCANGRYIEQYQTTAPEPVPPELVWTGDINNDSREDLLVATQQCEDEDTCQYRTQVITWQDELGRFVNLVGGGITSFSLPHLNDIDDDNVAEIVVNLDSRGTALTGPLRTGVHIYDWNGSVYTLSITQLDPPRYFIQVIHEADRLFLRQALEEATPLYENMLEADDLRYWFNDGPVFIPSYLYYRLLLAYSRLSDPRLLATYERMREAYPEPESAPTFIRLAYEYWDVLQVTSNLHSACAAVLESVEENPRALELLNRYGTRSPTYEMEDLCPF